MSSDDGKSTNPGKWSGLAARINRVFDESEKEQARRDAEAQAAVEEARAARQQLFVELIAFGQAVPRLNVQREPGVLVLGHGLHWIRFAYEGDLDGVVVTTSADPAVESRLQRDMTFGKRWMLSWNGGETHRWFTLFDHGLEVLVNTAYGLHLPEEDLTTAKAALFIRGTGDREKLVIVEDA